MQQLGRVALSEDESHYQRWYRDHYRHRGFGADNAIAGIFGFTLGSVIGGTIEHSGRAGHVAACEDRFLSYDRRSDTYLGFDGRRQACML